MRALHLYAVHTRRIDRVWCRELRSRQAAAEQGCTCNLASYVWQGCMRTRAAPVLGQHFSDWARESLFGAAVIRELPAHDARVQAPPILILGLKCAVVAAPAADRRTTLACLARGDAVGACCGSWCAATPPAASAWQSTCQAARRPRPHRCEEWAINEVNAFHLLWQARHTRNCMSGSRCSVLAKCSKVTP